MISFAKLNVTTSDGLYLLLIQLVAQKLKVKSMDSRMEMEVRIYNKSCMHMYLGRKSL